MFRDRMRNCHDGVCFSVFGFCLWSSEIPFSTLLLANVSYLSWLCLVVMWVFLLVHTVNIWTFLKAVLRSSVAVKQSHRFSHLFHEGCIFLFSHSEFYELTSTWKKTDV